MDIPEIPKNSGGRFHQTEVATELPFNEDPFVRTAKHLKWMLGEMAERDMRTAYMGLSQMKQRIAKLETMIETLIRLYSDKNKRR